VVVFPVFRLEEPKQHPAVSEHVLQHGVAKHTVLENLSHLLVDHTFCDFADFVNDLEQVCSLEIF